MQIPLIYALYGCLFVAVFTAVAVNYRVTQKMDEILLNRGDSVCRGIGNHNGGLGNALVGFLIGVLVTVAVVCMRFGG